MSKIKSTNVLFLLHSNVVTNRHDVGRSSPPHEVPLHHLRENRAVPNEVLSPKPVDLALLDGRNRRLYSSILQNTQTG
ncbi:uncharacterized protein LOC114351348 isoform X1 [Ostrinia furnacalis]|uniref:uncharacterized protein LOC114351348 isoform X1 n=1 Tax=Ostrinia furnacalis TaxID=93504 RepID=UPI00103CC657|nr:uncharacterized protein LOC114351348 isoform X1 [Ostrinia furnacalis]